MATPRKPKDQHLKRGRPTLYKPEYCQMLIEHGMEGRPFETFGAKVGHPTSTLKLWAEEHPEFMAAKEMAKTFAMDWWLEKGRANLIINPDEKFNSTIWIFTLKAMFQLRDGSESKAQLDNPVGKTKEQLEAYEKEIKELREAMEIRSLKLVSG